MTTRRTSRAPSPGGALHAVSELSTVPCIFYYYYLELPQTLLLPRKNKTGKSTPFHVINSLPAHAGLGVCFLGWAELRRPDATAETPGPRLGERQGAEWGGGSGGGGGVPRTRQGPCREEAGAWPCACVSRFCSPSVPVTRPPEQGTGPTGRCWRGRHPTAPHSRPSRPPAHPGQS